MRNPKIQNTANRLSNPSNLSSLNNVAILKALADPVRIQIIELLKYEQLCVCHLTQELELAQPLISHHIKVLKEAGLIESNRYRYWTYYCLDVEAISEIAFAIGAFATTDKSCSSTGLPKRPC